MVYRQGLGFLGVAVLILAACGGSGPAAPEMPEHWEVVSDEVMPPDVIKEAARMKGIKVQSARTITYDVDGKQIRLWITLADSAADISKLEAAAREARTEEMSFGRDLTFYSFKSDDDALAEISAGKAHLQKTLP